MPTITKEAELRAEVSALKQKLSQTENANGMLSRQLASAQKAQASAEAKAAKTAELETLLGERDAQIGRLQADLGSANARAEKADQLLDAARGLKILVDSV